MAKKQTTYVALKRLRSKSTGQFTEIGEDYIPPAEANPADIQKLLEVGAIAEKGSDEAKTAAEVSDGSNV